MTYKRGYSLDVEEIPEGLRVTVSPDHGRRVTFYATTRPYRRSPGCFWVVSTSLIGGGYLSSHRSQDAAMKSALFRARRYGRAYGVPRGLAVAS